MEHDDDSQQEREDQSFDLPNSTTPALVRRLFHDQFSTSPILSKPDYMARAVRQMLQESPNVPANDLAIYLSEFELLYEEHRLNTPTANTTPPTDPQRIKMTLPPPQHNSSPVINASMPMPPPSTPIQVVISRDGYTDKEREVIILKPDSTVQDFLIWQRGAKTTLALIDNYQDGILLRPRNLVGFHSSLTESQIDKLYLNTWMKLHMATQKVCSINTDIARIEPLEIHTLWKKLQTTYLPTTASEIFKLEQAVYTMEQGILPAKDFVTLLRDKTHELSQLGHPVQKSRILNLLLEKLKNETLKMFIFSLPTRFDLDECFSSILSFGKSMHTDVPQPTPNPKLEHVLAVVHKQPDSDREFQGVCYICHNPGHRAHECAMKHRQHQRNNNTNTYNNTHGGHMPNSNPWNPSNGNPNTYSSRHESRPYQSRGNRFPPKQHSGRNNERYQPYPQNNRSPYSPHRNDSSDGPNQHLNNSNQRKVNWDPRTRDQDEKRSYHTEEKTLNTSRMASQSQDDIGRQINAQFRVLFTDLMSEIHPPPRRNSLEIEGTPQQLAHAHSKPSLMGPPTTGSGLPPASYMIIVLDDEPPTPTLQSGSTNTEGIIDLTADDPFPGNMAIAEYKDNSCHLPDSTDIGVQQELHPAHLTTLPTCQEISRGPLLSMEIEGVTIDTSSESITLPSMVLETTEFRSIIPYRNRDTNGNFIEEIGVVSIRELEEWGDTQDITNTGFDSEGISPETVQRMFEEEEIPDTTTDSWSEEDIDLTDRTSTCLEYDHMVACRARGHWFPRVPPSPTDPRVLHHTQVHREWTQKNDMGALLINSDTPRVPIIPEQPAMVRRNGKQPIQPSVGSTHFGTISLQHVRASPLAQPTTCDRATQTDAEISLTMVPDQSDTTEPTQIPHRILMITTEAPSVGEPRHIYTDNPYQRSVKQLLSIRCAAREAVQHDESCPNATPSKGPTLEYTIEFMDILQETKQDAYGNIFHETFKMDNYIFTQAYEEAVDQHETLIRRLGDVMLERHTALHDHALAQKEAYESAYSKYSTRSPTFVFKYDISKCRRPEPYLDTGDVRYTVQLARYYFTLKKHLDEAYRIHKRITHYQQQVCTLQATEAAYQEHLSNHLYQLFNEHNTVPEIEFSQETEAYWRMYRNHLTKRVHELQSFFHNDSVRRSYQIGDPIHTDIPRQPGNLSSLSYVPARDDPYDPFAPEHDEATTLFPDTRDYTCELEVHNFLRQDLLRSGTFDVALVDDQNGRELSHYDASQQYDLEPALADPVLPTVDETKAQVRQAICEYRRIKRNKDKNRRRNAKKRARQQGPEQALMLSDTVGLVTGKPPTEAEIIFDSGCTAHMWNHRAHFTTYTPYTTSHMKAACASGQTVDILGKGDIGPIKDVLYVPQLNYCLLSSSAFLKQGYGMYIGTIPKVIKETNPTEVLLRGYYSGDLFQITPSEFERQLGLRPITCFVHDITVQPLLQVHQMLGHASATRCAYECKCTNFPGLANLSTKTFQAIKECEECAMAKSKRRSFTGHLDPPQFIGQTWYVDVKGPIATPSLVYGNHYVFGIIDGKTKFLIQYFMQTKDEVLSHFRLFHDEFIPLVRASQPNLGVITVYSDMGEFHSNAVIEFCQEKGILHRTTCAYSPENNGLIERTWRTISESSIAMLLTANLTEPYWEEARRTAGYIRNRIVGGHPSLDTLSPFEKFFGIKSHIRHFKVFGVWAFPRIPVHLGDHTAKADKGIFVGYSDETMGGYRIYFPLTNSFGHSNHVTFGKSPNRTTDTTEITTTSLDSMITNLHLELQPVKTIQTTLTPDVQNISPTTVPLITTDLRISPNMDNNIMSLDDVSGVQQMEVPTINTNM